MKHRFASVCRLVVVMSLILIPLGAGHAVAAGQESGQGMAGHEIQGPPGQGMGMGQGMGHGMAQASGNAPWHEATVDGYAFTCEAIDMGGRMAGVKGMENISHHLMVYVTGPDGQPLTNAALAYRVVGPDGKEQKGKFMGMGKGFGANLGFKAPGHYKVETTLTAGDKTVVDAFEHNVP